MQSNRYLKTTVSLLGVSAKMGVTKSALENLLAGHVTVGVASKLGVTTKSVQEFIDGKAGVGMSSALGILTSTLQELRDQIGREGAIGLVVGACIARNSRE